MSPHLPPAMSGTTTKGQHRTLAAAAAGRAGGKTAREEEHLDVGRALQHLRGDLTQAQMAARAKLTRAAWSLYECGKRAMRADKRERVLTALGCTRLQFEEVVWAFRRRRLLAEQSRTRANAAQQPSLKPGAVRLPPTAAQLPADLQELRARSIGFLDELLGLAAQARSGL